ncbi:MULTISPECIES: cytochrome c maturation protein CcmE [Bacillaceae]|uniref:cytochrome c maturation protein CcmE n=1 Tax=Bacillaceae TaxID=186817 RepID=UPI000832C396|nr:MULTISPECIES: cytochrome c maturation protein CcmE [Bacillaceae]MCM3765239.1 cytochrome c maturation protein CcmE [Neobacillus niacini]
MKKNTLVMLGGFIIAGAIVFLLMAATPGSSGVELTMKELLANQQDYKDDFVTVEGLLVEDSIKWDADKIELKFDVKDNDGNIMHVIHNGTKPDNFSDGVITILQGAPTQKNTFVAETVKTRCPSKYEGEDMKNYDPETHKEKLNQPPKEQ